MSMHIIIGCKSSCGTSEFGASDTYGKEKFNCSPGFKCWYNPASRE